MKRLIRPLTLTAAFLVFTSLIVFGGPKGKTQSVSAVDFSIPESFKNSNISKVRKELASVLKFAEKAKQSAREIVTDRFLLNDAELDCHGVAETGSDFPGIVSFEKRSTGELVIHGYNSIFSEKDDMTISIKKDETGSSTIAIFSNESVTEMRVSETGSGSYKKQIDGKFSNSISWNETGKGVWARMTKTGKFSSGNFGEETLVADSDL